MTRPWAPHKLIWLPQASVRSSERLCISLVLASEKLVLPRTVQGAGHMKKSMQEGSLRAQYQVPTLADGGGQSTESTLSEWHEWALSPVRKNTQQYHLLRGDKGRRNRQGLSKRRLNHLSYSLTVGNNQGKSKNRTIPEQLHVCLPSLTAPVWVPHTPIQPQ